MVPHSVNNLDDEVIVYEKLGSVSEKKDDYKILRKGAFCGAQRTPMRFRADAVRSITPPPETPITVS